MVITRTLSLGTSALTVHVADAMWPLQNANRNVGQEAGESSRPEAVRKVDLTNDQHPAINVLHAGFCSVFDSMLLYYLTYISSQKFLGYLT